MSDGAKVLKLIAREAPDVQRRIHVMAQVLRDLLEASGWEAQLAFTLVMAELAEAK